MSNKKALRCGDIEFGRVGTFARFRTSCGKATGENGKEYQLSTEATTGEPIITSRGTGKSFTIEWSSLLALALAAGIDKEDKKDER